MKIDNHSNLSGISTPGSSSAAKVDSGAVRDAGGKVTSPDSDSAELSGTAGKVSKALSQDAADRAAKVEQLRAAVANGTYNVTPAEISRGIVNDALASSATAGG